MDKTNSTEDFQAKEEELRRQADQFKASTAKIKKQINARNRKINGMICCLLCCFPCITVSKNETVL